MSDPIEAVFAIFASDSGMLELLGLTAAAEDDEINARIVRGMEPEKPVTVESAPLICMHTKPGRFGRNHLAFEGKFSLDFYGKTRYQAKALFERAYELLHDKYLSAANFHSYRCTLAFDSDMATGIAGVKGYTAFFDVDYIRINRR